LFEDEENIAMKVKMIHTHFYIFTVYCSMGSIFAMSSSGEVVNKIKGKLHSKENYQEYRKNKEKRGQNLRKKFMNVSLILWNVPESVGGMATFIHFAGLN